MQLLVVVFMTKYTIIYRFLEFTTGEFIECQSYTRLQILFVSDVISVCFMKYPVNSNYAESLSQNAKSCSKM